MSRRFILKITCLLLIFGFMVTNVFGKPYKTNVVCSYYAEDFHGKKTSNGEIFNMYSLTCAHKSLPFNTVLRITNRANGRSVEVRVNDRGPFVTNREVDLSKAAAVKLDMIKSGTAHCDITIVKMGPNTKLSRDTAAAADRIMRERGLIPKSKPQKGTTGGKSSGNTVKHGPPVLDPANKNYETGTYWDIQVGAYSQKENANKVAQQLMKKGFKNLVLQKTTSVYRVVIRNVPWNKVKATNTALLNAGYNNILIRQRIK